MSASTWAANASFTSKRSMSRLAEPVLLEQRGDSEGRREEELLRFDARGVVVGDGGDRAEAQFLRLGEAGDHHGGGAGGDLAGVARSDRAVLGEGRAEFRERLRGASGSDAFVLLDARSGVALLGGHGHDFVARNDRRPRRPRPVGGSGR